MGAPVQIDDLLGLAGGVGSDPAIVPAEGVGSVKSVAGGAYDGANRFDRELALWAPPITSADNEILPAKAMADARTRDTMRNDAYISNIGSIHQNYIVGSVFLLNAKPSTRVLWGQADDVWEEEFQEEVEEKFTLWAESSECWVDATRRNTFSEMVRLVTGINFMGGESFSAVEWLREESDRPFNTAILLLDNERITTPPTAQFDVRVRGGVRRNKRGRPLGYYVRQAHPSDFRDPDVHDFKYVRANRPWGRKQIIHIFEQVRPDQTRGISELTAMLRETYQARKIRDVALQNMIVNSSYAAAIESDLPTDVIFNLIGGGNVTNDGRVEEAISTYMDSYLSTVAQYVGKSKYAQLDGVKIPHLPPGSKLNLMPVGKGGLLGTEFEQSLLRYLAAGSGVSGEQVSRDYSRTNYSSIKAALADTQLYMASKKKIIADRWATAVFKLWFEEAYNRGAIETLNRPNAPNYYDPLMAEAYTACDWIGASRGQIEELKETQAAIARLNAGISTREIEIARFGRDYRKVFRQIAREQRMADELGLDFSGNEAMMGAVSDASSDDQEAREPRDDQ
ncbi:phage portal protein [Alterisphingorhabdus coralli]|uniref:Phage portal protein n=1 Tax=Alterisphingorhabdus coralli TaxID=3071408 RepID=A0AA97FAR1_9SPHN|nr:phage portal protein [Parasphingorhabdus sp. SCSIO 66989]WOE76313.1 phage portal protein [Parasphingorhabdus sp. SCSIO 66989]